MECYSRMIGGEEHVYTIKKKKEIEVAIFNKKGCIAIYPGLYVSYLSGYYLRKGFPYNSPIEYLEKPSKDVNIFRVNYDRMKYLNRFVSLKYQRNTFDIRIKQNIFEEIEYRKKYNHEIEMLGKANLKELIIYPSVLELKNKYIKPLLNFIRNNPDYLKNGVAVLLYCVRHNLSSFDGYEELKFKNKLIKTFKFSNEDAKSFIKNYGIDSRNFDLYKDSLILAKKCGVDSIGFPKNLTGTHIYYLSKVNAKAYEEENKILNKLPNIYRINFKKKNTCYDFKILSSNDDFNFIADEFHNCIAKIYKDEVLKHKCLIILVKKENEDFACLEWDLETKKIGQLYEKYNKALPMEEDKLIRRNFKVLAV